MILTINGIQAALKKGSSIEYVTPALNMSLLEHAHVQAMCKHFGGNEVKTSKILPFFLWFYTSILQKYVSFQVFNHLITNVLLV